MLINPLIAQVVELARVWTVVAYVQVLTGDVRSLASSVTRQFKLMK